MIVAASALALLLAPVPGTASPPSRTASTFQWARAVLPANRPFFLTCARSFSGTTTGLLGVSIRSRGFALTTFATSDHADGRWVTTRVGPHRTHERVSPPDGDGGFSVTMVVGESSARSVLSVASATWGRASSACLLVVAGRIVPMRAGQRSKATYFTAVDAPSSAGVDSSEGSTAASLIERTSTGLLFATGGNDAGAAFAVRPDGRPMTTEGPRLELAEPGRGTWRFGFAGAKESSFPQLYTVEIPT